jgi:F-type H+-transporting ATPase subunit b
MVPELGSNKAPGAEFPPPSPNEQNFMEILNQLGSLVLGSVPTILFFLLLIAAYSVLVRKPLERTLAERQARTSGAVEQARGAIAAAEAETAVYEDKLRAARSEILAARDERLKQWQSERDAALAETRAAAQGRVQGARAEIEASASVARKQIEDATGTLSEQILRAVLPAGTNLSEVRQ